MATKRKEWSRRVLCVGNQNKAVRAYGCMELTKSLWQSKVSIFIKNICVTQWKWLSLTEEPTKCFFFLLFFFLKTRQASASPTHAPTRKAGAACQTAAAFGFFQLRLNLQV